MNERLAADIERLIQLFVAQGWNELRLAAPDFELLISTDPDAAPLGAEDADEARPAARTPAQAPSTRPQQATASAPVSVDPAWIAVNAPNLGTFYRSPKPGAPPFVEVDQAVGADTEICLLEVMKLFTSVKAGSAGVVRQICAEDAQLVETGQVLFYLEPVSGG